MKGERGEDSNDVHGSQFTVKEGNREKAGKMFTDEAGGIFVICNLVTTFLAMTDRRIRA